MKRQYDKRVKLPQKLVEELMRASVLGQQAWVKARQDSDFATFSPHIEKIYHLKRQQAECLGYTDSPYDALLDEFEPDAKTADVAKVLAQLRAELVPLVQAIIQSGRRDPVEILQSEYPTGAQVAFD